MSAQRNFRGSISRLPRTDEMKLLGDELRLIACRALADQSGLNVSDPRYAEIVNDYYRRSLLVESQKSLHVLPVKSFRRELDELRHGVEQLTLRALIAGATSTQILEFVGSGIDRAAEALQTKIQRQA